jgi:hypothetical protein
MAENQIVYSHKDLIEDLSALSNSSQLAQFIEKITEEILPGVSLNKSLSIEEEDDELDSNIYEVENKSLEIAQKLTTMGQPQGWFQVTEEKLETFQTNLEKKKNIYFEVAKDNQGEAEIS